MHPERAGARAAVERDEERPPRGVGHVGALVVGVVERGDRLAVLTVDGLRAGGYPIRNALAEDRHLGGRGDLHVRREGPLGQVDTARLLALPFHCLVGRLLGRCREGEEQGHEGQECNRGNVSNGKRCHGGPPGRSVR